MPLRGEGSCGGGGAPRDSAGSGARELPRAHRDLTSMAPHKRLPELPVVPPEKPTQASFLLSLLPRHSACCRSSIEIGLPWPIGLRAKGLLTAVLSWSEDLKRKQVGAHKMIRGFLRAHLQFSKVSG